MNFIFLGVFVLGDNYFQQAIILAIFIIFNILQVFCILYYVLLSATEVKSTQDIFPLASVSNSERNYKNINPFLTDFLLEQSIEKTNICHSCKTYKPPRCQHCTRCEKCYLMFNYHCIFVDTCIGFHNYKFYIQFLIANFIMLLFYIVVVTVEFVLVGDFGLYILFHVVVVDFLTLIILVINFQKLLLISKLVINNETLPEYIAINRYLNGDHSMLNVFQEGPITVFSDSKDRKILNPYNLGYRANMREIFGDTIWEWISPSFTSKGDGISFRKNNID